jgi:hypothetical protein
MRNRNCRSLSTLGGLFALACGAGGLFIPGNANAVPVWGYASDITSVFITGATIKSVSTESLDSAHLVQGGMDFKSVSNDNATDAAQAASGPAKPPRENTFEPVGANAGLARGDSRLADFGRRLFPTSAITWNLAEVYLAAAGSGSATGTDILNFQLTQTAAAITVSIVSNPLMAVETTAAGDVSRAILDYAVTVFDGTNANKKMAIWNPCGMTAPMGAVGLNTCGRPGAGLTKDAGFTGTVTVLQDPYTLNNQLDCADAGCVKTYVPKGAGVIPTGQSKISINVGIGKTIDADINAFESVLVSGTQLAAPQPLPQLVAEPASLAVSTVGLVALCGVVSCSRRYPRAMRTG